jgi:hypothetical protein
MSTVSSNTKVYGDSSITIHQMEEFIEKYKSTCKKMRNIYSRYFNCVNLIIFDEMSFEKVGSIRYYGIMYELEKIKTSAFYKALDGEVYSIEMSNDTPIDCCLVCNK